MSLTTDIGDLDFPFRTVSESDFLTGRFWLGITPNFRNFWKVLDHDLKKEKKKRAHQVTHQGKLILFYNNRKDNPKDQ